MQPAHWTSQTLTNLEEPFEALRSPQEGCNWLNPIPRVSFQQSWFATGNAAASVGGMQIRATWQLWLDLESCLVPEPAVSVPRAKLTRPAPTAAPDPEEDPPGMNLQCAYPKWVALLHEARAWLMLWSRTPKTQYLACNIMLKCKMMVSQCSSKQHCMSTGLSFDGRIAHCNLIEAIPSKRMVPSWMRYCSYCYVGHHYISPLVHKQQYSTSVVINGV